MHAKWKAGSCLVGSGVLGLLALLFAICGLAAGPEDTAARIQSGSFCELPSAAEVSKRLGEAPPPRGIKLVVNKEEVRPGDVVKARLLNFDEKVNTYGAEFKIQRYGSMSWRTDPSSPAGPWPRYLGKLRPGEAGRCYSFSVPADQDSGRYRFFTKVRSGSKQQGKTSEFGVR
jgi:hypothetical protein